MNIAQETLNGWRVRMETFRTKPVVAQLAMARGNAEEARDILTDLHLLAAATATEMEQAGADRPKALAPAPDGYDVSLALLGSDANKRVLALLTDALEQAKRVDEERGTEPGEGATSGLLSMLVEHVGRECYGARE